MIENDKVKLTAILIGTTIFFAYIKQYLYYSFFNIDISNYISINEVFTPFIDDLVILSIFILFIISVTAIMVSGMLKFLNSRNTNVLAESNEGKKLNLIGKITEHKYFSPSFYILSLLAISYKLYSVSENYIIWIIFIPMILICVVHIVMISYNQSIKEFKQNNSSDFNRYKILLPIFLMYLVSTSFFSLLAFIEIDYKTKKEHKEKTYIFKLSNDKDIITDSTIIYLGRTDNNIFILNKYVNKLDSSLCRVDVYNKSNVIKEQIVENKQATP